MIIVTEINRDGNNPDNSIFTVRYDVSGLEQPLVYMDYPMQDIVIDTAVEIKDKVLAFVAVERGDELWGQVQSKVNPYLGIDLEP